MKKVITLLSALAALFSTTSYAEVTLTDGVIHPIPQSEGADLEFKIVLAEPQSSLNIFIKGKTGNADLSLVEVNGALVDCETGLARSNEACVVKQPDAGTYRFRISSVEPFADLIVFASSQVYTIQHSCSGMGNETRLNIQNPEIGAAQITEICSDLMRAEVLFHELMVTNNEVVPNDQNDLVNVNIFANQAAFKTTGQYDQNMQDSASTGIYFESSPESRLATADVNTFEAVNWADGEFFIWELAHEYVHYLDGRYNKQGNYGSTVNHNLTWWTEGVAEYIADHASPYMNVRLVHSPENFTASEIVESGYDGEASPYEWGSLLVRFMTEQRPQDLQTLRELARSGSYSDLDDWLAQWASEVQEEFSNWQNGTLIEDIQHRAEPLDYSVPIEATSQHGLLYYLDVGDGESFSVQSQGGGGDADIYIQFEDTPNKYNATKFQCRANSATTEEICGIETTQAGRYYVLFDAPGYSIFVNTQLSVSDQLLLTPVEYSLCASEVPYSGRDSSSSAGVDLKNNSEQAIKIYWLNNNNGARSSEPYDILPVGESWQASWSSGDVFLITDESDNCLKTHVLQSGTNKLSFDGTDVTEVEETSDSPKVDDATAIDKSSGGPVYLWLLAYFLMVTAGRRLFR